MEQPVDFGDPPRVYRILRWVPWLIVSIFYRRVDMTGMSRFPDHRPIILAANHTNGLADPFLIAARIPGEPRFMAASSWWRLAPARWLFKMTATVPIHRRQDGQDQSSNTEIFAACHQALARGAQRALFPEGEVHLEPAMLPLKTGAARIALSAAADAGVREIAIVPVGLMYEDQGRFRSQAAIHIGRPIEIDDWAERYRADPQGTTRAVTEVLTNRLRDVTLNHASWREAMVVDRAAAITTAGEREATEHQSPFSDRTALHRALITAIEIAGGEDSDEFRRLAKAVDNYRRDLAVLGVDEPRAVPRLQAGRIRLRQARLTAETAALLPFATMGVVLDGPVVLAARVVTRRVPSPIWQATAKALTGFLLLPILWGTETTLVYRRWGGKAALATAAAGPVGGLAWIAWRTRWLRLRQTRRSIEWFAKPNEALKAARASREAVLEEVVRLVGEPAVARSTQTI